MKDAGTTAIKRMNAAGTTQIDEKFDENIIELLMFNILYLFHYI